MKKLGKLIRVVLFFLPLAVSAYGINLLKTYPYLSEKTTNLIIAGVLAISILALLLGLFSVMKHKKVLANVVLVFCLIISGGIGYLDYVYSNIDEKVNAITDATEYEYSYVYVLDTFEGDSLSDLDDKTIGMKSETNELGYIMPCEELDSLDINYDIEIYANGNMAAADLLEGKVDAIVILSSELYTIDDLYVEFSTSTKCIGEFKKVMETTDTVKSVNMSEEAFTVLISGVDTRLGQLNGGSRSDVLMLATFNPKTLKLNLTSIPRDSYIPVTCEGGVHDKITHSGNFGIDCTVESLENYFGIEINYYIKCNFVSVVELVDAIGGIDIDVPITFCEQNSEGLEDAICLDEGYQHLDGEEALALCRHRHSLAFEAARGPHQQLVIKAIINKLASGQIVTSANELLEVAGDNVQTNMPKEDIIQLFNFVTEIGSSSLYSNTSSLSITSDTLQGEAVLLYADWANADISYYVPYVQSKQLVLDNINRVLGTEDYDLPTSFAYNCNKIYNEYEESKLMTITDTTLEVDTSSGIADPGSQSAWYS